MPIKWSALRVSEAADEAEGFISQIKEPLESVKLVCEEAEKIPNLPEYMSQNLSQLRYEVDRVIGGVTSWNKRPFDGSFDRLIQRIREHIPADALASEKKTAVRGRQQALIS